MTIIPIPTGVASRLSARFQQDADHVKVRGRSLRSQITELLADEINDDQYLGMEVARLGAELAATGKESRILHRAASIALNSPDDLQEYAIELLGESPDDTWSGRQNDARRVVADQVRETAKSILRYVEREMERHDRDAARAILDEVAEVTR